MADDAPPPPGPGQLQLQIEKLEHESSDLANRGLAQAERDALTTPTSPPGRRRPRSAPASS